MYKIIEYLKKEYNPLAIVVYGSYASGTNDEYSDFDCMIIVEEKSRKHDDSVINGIQLDCFIYTKKEIQSKNIDKFIAVFNGDIVLDTEYIAENLKTRVQEYVKDHSITSMEEKQFIISWIKKTMRRAEKNDDEGNYRAVAFLSESLADYFQLRDLFYFGSKRSISYLRDYDKTGYQLYHKAITERSNAAISLWVEHVINIDLKRCS